MCPAALDRSSGKLNLRTACLTPTGWTIHGWCSYQPIMGKIHRLIVICSTLLVVAASSSAVEVTVGPASPVTDTSLLASDSGVLPLAVTGHNSEFGVLFHTDADYWFSIVRGGAELVTTHLMTIADRGFYSLPDEFAKLNLRDQIISFRVKLGSHLESKL